MDFETLRSQRARVKGQITRVSNWLANEAAGNRNVKLFELKYDRLVTDFNKYQTTQDQIESAIPDDVVDSEDRTSLENRIEEMLAELKTHIDALSPCISNVVRSSSPAASQQDNVPTPISTIKLPELKIHPFDGKLPEWVTFFQLFEALIIDNHSLSDIQRFIYLKSFLKDEPLKIIESLPATNENFQVAIDLLKKRYENKLAVINGHFISLLEIDPIVKCSSENLRKFVTNVKKNLDLINNLNCSTQELWELLLMYLFQKKLDPGTRKAFESKRDHSQIPNLNKFMEFLELQATQLETLSVYHQTERKPHSRVVLHSNNQHSNSDNRHQSSYCVFCQQANHKIYGCEKYKKLNLTEKRSFVNNKNLCYNCLGSNHSRNECKSSGCLLCSQRHHTSLHDSRNQSSFQRPYNLPHRSSINNSTGPNQNGFRNSTPMNRPSTFSNNTQISNNSSGQNANTNRGHTNLQTRSNSPSTDPIVNNHNNPIVNNGNQTLHANSLNLSTVNTKHSYVLLATACGTVYTAQNRPLQVRVLLDSASQNSFVTTNLVAKLKYVPYNQSLSISGISQDKILCNKMINLNLYSNVYNKTVKVSTAVIPNITCKLPQVPIDKSTLHIPPYVKLSDPLFATPAEIDMLIGADRYYDLLLNDVIKLGENLPVLQNTLLGWIIAGNIPASPPSPSHCLAQTLSHFPVNDKISLFVHSDEQPPLDALVQKFWTMEEVPNKPITTSGDERAEKIFVDTTLILPNGSYQVDLPIKSPEDTNSLGDSFIIAKKRFENLEKRFQKDPAYFTEYKKFIYEYLELNHAHVVPLKLTNELSQNKYFFPHHAIIKEQSTTTKLRVVFDGSCKTTTKVSLNDITLKGYQVQPDLYDILCRFRSYKFVLTCDIEKMYRQILINPTQTFLLNILWREDPHKPFQCLELLTVTYGTNCAPFLATRVLQDIAERNESKFPLASNALTYQCYVDDILTGADSLSDLKLLHKQLNQILNSHNFTLHKWASNSGKALTEISQRNFIEHVIDGENNPNKVLGLKWNPREDNLCISIPSVSLAGPVTKRKILSIIAQCYDPLGLLSAVIVLGKLIMQKLWLLKLDWDVQITDQSILTEWTNFIDSLPLLATLKIPRCIFENNEKNKIEFHGFADASMKAYAACVYVRTVYKNGTVSTHLVTSKSRVAPLKVVSLPRLELCAMLLLAKVVQNVVLIYEARFKPDHVYLYTDSTIALAWIASHASKWNTFVANRVASIQDLTSDYTWHHVRSADNPADLPSRGVLPQVLNCNLWWCGPNFLKDANINFSRLEDQIHVPDLPEHRKVTLFNVESRIKNDFWLEIFTRFSKFYCLQRSLAYVLRFSNNASHSKNKLTGPLSIDELSQSLMHILKNLQTHFAKERQELLSNRPISDKNLLGLNLFLDENNLIRVGGRLRNAEIAFEQKHPVLLPSHHHVVSLMLAQEHRRLGHAGAQAVLSNFRLKYWPLNGIRETKNVIKSCITCFRFKAQAAQQIMSDLPKCRVEVTRPFTITGVDYGGPFLIKTSKLRKAPEQRCHIAIFVCMSTKAIHIELVTELTTQSFILTLKRFISRRGNPAKIMSDNGTNFVGANNHLKELREFFKNKHFSTEIRNYLSQNEIEFQFIPPRSPHWGGIWESAIKSAKHHMKRIIGNARLTFEEFYTILTQIEAILNSRPLCAMSSDPNDYHPLTPGHFLIGSSLTAFPERDVTQISENRLKTWQRITQLQQHFWKRWSVEYFNRLQHRPKWMKNTTGLKVNDLVLLKEDNSPPLKWPLARVTKVFPGTDTKVRAVEIKTQDGIFTRSITKLCPLPITS